VKPRATLTATTAKTPALRDIRCIVRVPSADIKTWTHVARDANIEAE
jgi:hypothetical protein